MTSPTIRRVDLPSGGWWELETKPRWKHFREWSFDVGALSGSVALGDRVLVSLTPAWSFQEKVCLESLCLRDVADTAAVLEVLQREVLSPLSRERPTRLAEDLFVGLAAGTIPPPFAEVHLMALTGWSWETLLQTPLDVVEKMAIYRAVKETRETGGYLSFQEDENGE